MGQLIKAYVVLQSNDRGKISEEEIMEFCRQNLAHYKVPKIIAEGTGEQLLQDEVLRKTYLGL